MSRESKTHRQPRSIATTISRVLGWALVAGLLVAGVRFAVVTSRSESGWDMVASEWQDALLGPVGLGYVSLDESPPPQQARFWLEQADQVLADQPDSAELAMGAAWMLDSPGLGFLQSHLLPHTAAVPLTPFPPSLDEATIARQKEEFRRLATGRVLELAKRATELDGDDVRWWRMRALLMFEGDVFLSDKEFTARSPDWLEVLDQCKQHDPKNALYDYLAALELWNSSARYEPQPVATQLEPPSDSAEIDQGEEALEVHPEDDTWVLSIDDPDRFAEGVARLETAQRLPYLAIGEAGYGAIAELLDRSPLRSLDRSELAVSRIVTARQSLLCINLWRWQDLREEAASLAGDPQEHRKLLQQDLRLFDQAIVPEETSALNTLTSLGLVRQHRYGALVRLAKEQPGLIEADELAHLRRREQELREEAAVLVSAVTQLQSARPFQSSAISWFDLGTVAASESAAWLLLLTGLLLLVATVSCRRSETAPRLGGVRSAVAWGLAYSISLVLFGMVPAGRISPRWQYLLVLAGLAIVVVGAMSLFAIHFVRRWKSRFRVITLLATTTVVALLAFLGSPLLRPILPRIKLATEPLLPARGWGGIDAEQLRTAMNFNQGSWQWVAVQWEVYSGPYLTPLLALVLVTLWYLTRSAWQSNDGLVRAWRRDFQPLLAGLLFSLGKSALVVAGGWMLLYLCLAPTVVRKVEAEFQDQMQYCRDPVAHVAEIRDAQSAVRNSPGELARIRQEVATGFQEENRTDAVPATP